MIMHIIIIKAFNCLEGFKLSNSKTKMKRRFTHPQGRKMQGHNWGTPLILAQPDNHHKDEITRDLTSH